MKIEVSVLRRRGAPHDGAVCGQPHCERSVAGSCDPRDVTANRCWNAKTQYSPRPDSMTGLANRAHVLTRAVRLQRGTFHGDVAELDDLKQSTTCWDTAGESCAQVEDR